MPTPYEIASCPVCGSAHADELASAHAVRIEVEELWTFHTRRLRPDTPPDQLNDRLVFSQQPPLRVVRCTRCGTAYRNPREHARDLLGKYRDESLAPDVMRRLFETQRRSYRAQARRLTRIVGGVGHGLEIGSYVGGFLAAVGELHAATDYG